MRNRHRVATKIGAACAHSTGAGGLFGLKNWATGAAQALWPSARGWLLAMGMLGCLQVGAEGIGASAMGGGATWQEEVLLHDGRTIVAERYVRRGGRAEIGQSGAYVEQQLSFSDPATGKTYTWSDGYSAELGMANFLVLALHVVDGVPYVVADPMGCQSYNKWGRPNPPYVIFMAQGNGWQRIDLADLPTQAHSANLLHSAPDEWVRRHGTRHVTAAQIQEENTTKQLQYRSILREPMVVSPCPQHSASPKAPD